MNLYNRTYLVKPASKVPFYMSIDSEREPFAKNGKANACAIRKCSTFRLSAFSAHAHRRSITRLLSGAIRRERCIMYILDSVKFCERKSDFEVETAIIFYCLCKFE